MNNDSREFEIDAIHFWDRQLTSEEMYQFTRTEMKMALYKSMGITLLCPALLMYEENAVLRMN
ncbi:MAG: hypothetical protein JXB49_01765 [Bacteroidales bacterium]|nr:hypothetical protein [Bacteroidales bacterium]